MESKNVLLLIGAIILLISYLIINEKINMSNNSYINEVNSSNKTLKYINSSYSIEHIIKINDNFLICSGEHFQEHLISQKNITNEIKEGSLLLYNIKTNELNPIIIENFPKNIPFHPHGIALYKINPNKYNLYVINHSIKSNPLENEERIEKLFLTINKRDLSLSFKNTKTLPKNFFGTLNSIAVINSNTIYFTTQKYFSQPFLKYKDNYTTNWLNQKINKLYEWLNIIFTKLNLKRTYLYSYNWETEEINVINNSEGISNHGLAYNSDKSLLYMARTYEKDIKVFEISRNDPSKALLIHDIKTIYHIINIIYDDEGKKIYGGLVGSMREFIEERDSNNVNIFCGFEEIDINNNYEITDLVIMKDALNGVNSAIKINNDVYLSSAYKNGLLIYQKN